MGIFGRLFTAGKAEIHGVVNKLEDPIKLTEQGIRDLKADLQTAMQGMAEVKGIAIRMTKEAEDARRQAGEYERKGMLLLRRGQEGQLDMAQAEQLAVKAVTSQGTANERFERLNKEAQGQQRMAAQLQEKITQLKTTISTYENELITLRARAKTAASTRKINQQLAAVDSSSTIAMLERMKEKVETEESLAQAYGEVADITVGNTDADIDRALLGSGGSGSGEDKLAALKAKMGIAEPAS